MFIDNLIITIRMVLFLNTIFFCLDSLTGNWLSDVIKSFAYKKLRRAGR